MDSELLLSGTRPPSVTGLRPLTASSKDFRYYSKKSHSAVDETLFHTHHPTSLHSPVKFTAPWERSQTTKATDKKKAKPGRPLLWAPPANNSQSTNIKTVFKKRNSASLDDTADDVVSVSQSLSTIKGIPMKHQYRRLKHTPTFVDESLFGDPLTEPSFKAPWEGKQKVKQLLTWCPEHQQEGKPVRRRRPHTASGLRSYSVSVEAVAPWKP